MDVNIGVVKLEEVAPPIFPKEILSVLDCHWYSSVGAPPVATTLIVWVPPVQMVAPVGWVVMPGSPVTVTFVQFEVTPQLLSEILIL